MNQAKDSHIHDDPEACWFVLLWQERLDEHDQQSGTGASMQTSIVLTLWDSTKIITALTAAL